MLRRSDELALEGGQVLYPDLSHFYHSIFYLLCPSCFRVHFFFPFFFLSVWDTTSEGLFSKVILDNIPCVFEERTVWAS